eukprot:CAMPEP_0117474320 /NCGR_PEP_ID=MMETSP0784-20121206/9224_1 /TAXON_ID=39447 /ORGANISM="" /LENGTH=629 /DNA_ID=CAMNT_0005268543 /DNA_START=14 /DNA_END=1899 /DNA_ORIENTATION=+
MADLTPRRRLYSIVAPRQYLNNEHHALNCYVKAVQEAIDSGDGDPHDHIDRLEKEVDAETDALARAFKLFDNSGKRALNRTDVKNMNRYLGFPADEHDVDELIAACDADNSGTLGFQEFENYVGWVGGSSKLFEERQRRLKERLGDSVGTADMETVAAALQQSGIDQEAQAYWKMVVPQSEFVEASKLTQCQSKAVAHIRRLAKRNHQEALPKLQARVHRLGFQDDALWLTLAWIRELAPILIHVNLDKMLQFIESDTHYRNQFETQTSGGLLKPDVRKKWERDLFGGMYDKAPSGFERPKYGVQNVMNDYQGVVKARQYGDSYVILKDVRLRCTFSPEDSANLKAEKLAVLDFYAHVLSEYSEAELCETLQVANSADAAVLGDSEKVGKMKYKEAQVHGEVAWDRHIERLVAHTRHRDAGMEERLLTVCSKWGWGFSWMDQERDRMKKESMHKFGGAAWKERLKALQEGGGDLDVPEGFCRVGCGRKVFPGTTRFGRPYTTCCRGCIMGFGHDTNCGTIDASLVGPGMCVKGCGRAAALALDNKGRPLTTCCRGCAMGVNHDKTCRNELPDPERIERIRQLAAGATAVPDGLCKMNCGRRVAPGVTRSGRSFDTCCAGCAKGQAHSST